MHEFDDDNRPRQLSETVRAADATISKGMTLHQGFVVVWLYH